MAREKKSTTKKKQQVPLHPWRECPLGEHWVRTHPRNIKPTGKKPGYITSVEGHCRNNRSHKDQMYSDEMEKIAEEHFGKLKGFPASDDLGFPNGNKYDELIRGWTQYWNDVFGPSEPLDPNFVKAVIASESGFNPNADNEKRGEGRARGLMQVTEQTRKILQSEKGELGDRLLDIDKKDLTNPNFNICAGTRWLFRKKEIVESRLGRPTTWREVLIDYKSYRGKPNAKGMRNFDDYYNRLKKSAQKEYHSHGFRVYAGNCEPIHDR